MSKRENEDEAYTAAVEAVGGGSENAWRCSAACGRQCAYVCVRVSHRIIALESRRDSSPVVDADAL